VTSAKAWGKVLVGGVVAMPGVISRAVLMSAILSAAPAVAQELDDELDGPRGEEGIPAEWEAIARPMIERSVETMRKAGVLKPKPGATEAAGSQRAPPERPQRPQLPGRPGGEDAAPVQGWRALLPAPRSGSVRASPEVRRPAVVTPIRPVSTSVTVTPPAAPVVAPVVLESPRR